MEQQRQVAKRENKQRTAENKLWKTSQASSGTDEKQEEAREKKKSKQKKSEGARHKREDDRLMVLR